MWKKHFTITRPAKLKVVPYKLNMYSKGGKFVRHKDSPEKGLIGTVILSLGNTSDARLMVDRGYRDYTCYFHDETPGKCFGFFPNKVHSVPELKKGFRANISFKVYAEEDKGPEFQPLNIDALKRLAGKTAFKMLREEIKEGPVGLICEQDYAQPTKSLTGSDLLVYQALSGVEGVNVVSVPILVQEDGTKPHNSDPRKVAIVYDVSDASLQHLREYQPEYADPEDELDISFFNLKGWNGRPIRVDDEDSVDYVGNESRPGTKDGVYFQRAIIFYRKKE
jgi:hypothetical protein